MLLTRSLPPQFLLPAWSAHQLALVARRSQSTKSNSVVRRIRSSSDHVTKGAQNDQQGLTPSNVYFRPRTGIKQIEDGKKSSKEASNSQNMAQIELREDSLPTDTKWNFPTRAIRPSQHNDMFSKSLAEDGLDVLEEEPQISLFDELFPEERKAAAKRKEAERRLEKLPAFNWDGNKVEAWDYINRGKRKEAENPIDKMGTYVPLGRKERRNQQAPEAQQQIDQRRREASLLVLNAASKTLEESDFFRLSPKGEHIEGWTSGIIKVIQGRDNQTLEPLSHYFILFSSPAAARAYLDETYRLHKLSLSRAAKSATSLPPPLGLLKPNEDLRTLLNGFTLVPAYGRLSLRMIHKPYGQTVTKMLSQGGPTALARQQGRPENMVIFSIDTGHVSVHDMYGTLGADGRQRNLPWKLAGGDKDILRLNEDFQVENDSASESGGRDRKKNVFTGPSRYMIHFKDRHEARRFVREWHRRPFPVQREHKIGDDAAPIVNAEILW